MVREASGSKKRSQAPIKTGMVGLVAVYLAFGAVIARTFTFQQVKPLLAEYLWFELGFLILFTFGWRFARPPKWHFNLYLIAQCGIVLKLVSLYPQFDYVVLLFLILGYQASLLLHGRLRLFWVMALALLTGVSLIYFLGFLRGLGLGLTTVAAEIVILAYILVSEETEAAKTQSQALLADLRESHLKLETFLSQVEELATVEERNRLSRTLHDTVSQSLFSISLTAHATELLIRQNPALVPAEIDRLQAMTADVLSQLRSLIVGMRPEDEHPQDFVQ